MAQASKITPSGTLYTAGTLDEVTYNARSGVTTNLLNGSNNFTNGVYWTVQNAPTLTPNASTAPDGTPTAWKYNLNAPSGRGVIQTLVGAVANQAYTFSIWVNAIQNTSFYFVININGVTTFVSIQPITVARGWQRLYYTFTPTSVTGGVQVQFQDVSGNTGDMFYVWGAQVELGVTPTIYVPTLATTAPAPTFASRTDSAGNTYITNTFDEVTYNPASGVKKNLISYSTFSTIGNTSYWNNRNSVVTSSALAPDGTNTALQVAYNLTFAVTQQGSSTSLAPLTVVPGQTYTASVYAKVSPAARFIAIVTSTNNAFANYDITNFTNSGAGSGATYAITPSQNGFYRCSLTWKAGVANENVGFWIGGYNGDNFTGDTMTLWAPQVELGSVPTIYEPTGANAVPVPPFAQRTELGGNVYVSGNYDEVSGILPVTDNLTLNFDPSYSQSYPGTGTTMYDIGGNTATATWSSTVRFVSNFQNTPTEYLQFYGNGAVTTNYVQPATTSADSFTWNVWFRATQNSAGEIIIGNRNSPGLDFCKLTTIAWEFYPTILTVVAPLNIWQNVTLVKNGTTLSYYRNATLVTTSTTSASKIANPFYIGGDSSYGEISTARIGQVQIYNRALTLAEITQVFNTFRIRYGI